MCQQEDGAIRAGHADDGDVGTKEMINPARSTYISSLWLRTGQRALAQRGCTRDDHGKAGPFSDERLKMDLPFVNVLCVQTSTQRSAGPLTG